MVTNERRRMAIHRTRQVATERLHASRLCDEARNGQILVDAKVHAEIETRVETESVGELTLKGFRRPVQAFNVCKLRL